jgi:hypothetical protein
VELGSGASSKAHIPAAGTVIALVFEMVEESTEESSVEVRQVDVRRRLAQQPLGMGQQQAEAVPVARQSMRARLPLPDETIREERLQKSGERAGGAHGWASGRECSTRRSTC